VSADREERWRRAVELLREAYRSQMVGDLERAIALYQESIAAHPTAEAHTFLGWTYSFQGRYEDAIAACRDAIAVDPEFGNPYNDIGSYLIKLGRPDEAVSWLEAAIRAPRYEPRHYPHCNLGQIYWAKGLLARAREEFERALALAPDYPAARAALDAIDKQLN
jgi:Tfp pilus assembly protein PilF